MHKNSIVRIRYIGFPTIKSVEVPGFCLDYLSKKEAERIMSSLSEYAMTSGTKKKLTIKILKEKDCKTKFLLIAYWKNSKLRIQISDIDQNIVESVKSWLTKVQYYVIVIGYTINDKFELIPPQRFSLFKSEFEENGEIIKGINLVPVDWMNLFSSNS